MPKGYRVIDADGHVVEPADLWEKRLEPDLRARAPQFTGHGIAFSFEGQQYPRLPADYPEELHEVVAEVQRKKGEAYHRDLGMEHGGALTPETQVQGMDKLGIDIAYLYPSRGLQAWAVDSMEPRLATAMAAAYNDWVFEYTGQERERLRPVAGLSLHDPAAAAREAQRVAERGGRSVFIRPNPINGRTLGDPAYEPLWAECERLNLAVGVHEGAYTLLTAAGADRFRRRFSLHACSHPMEHMMAFLALVEGGVLERHPTLRFAFLESGCGWVPYWLWRLDFEYGNLSAEGAENVKMKPSDYFRRQCYVAFEPDEPYIKSVVDCIGEDRLLFASDFPHASDHGVDITDETLELEDVLSKRVLKKILWDNPLTFYGDQA